MHLETLTAEEQLAEEQLAAHAAMLVSYADAVRTTHRAALGDQRTRRLLFLEQLGSHSTAMRLVYAAAIKAAEEEHTVPIPRKGD